MMKRAFFAALAAVSSAVAPAYAASSSHEIVIRGYVPVICNLSLQGAPAVDDTGALSVGTLREFCNNASGYRIVMQHDQNSSGVVYVDGAAIPLSGSGQTILKMSAHAGLGDLDVSIRSYDGLSFVNFDIIPL